MAAATASALDFNLSPLPILAEPPPPSEPWQCLAEALTRAADLFRHDARRCEHSRYIFDLLDGRAVDARILRASDGFELEDRLDAMRAPSAALQREAIGA